MSGSRAVADEDDVQGAVVDGILGCPFDVFPLGLPESVVATRVSRRPRVVAVVDDHRCHTSRVESWQQTNRLPSLRSPTMNVDCPRAGILGGHDPRPDGPERAQVCGLFELEIDIGGVRGVGVALQTHRRAFLQERVETDRRLATSEVGVFPCDLKPVGGDNRTDLAVSPIPVEAQGPGVSDVLSRGGRGEGDPSLVDRSNPDAKRVTRRLYAERTFPKPVGIDPPANQVEENDEDDDQRDRYGNGQGQDTL